MRCRGSRVSSARGAGRDSRAEDESPLKTPMTQIAEHEQSERAKVEGWRLHVLMEAGYPLPLAERLAHSEADLHAAVELVRRGCDAKIAAEILL